MKRQRKEGNKRRKKGRKEAGKKKRNKATQNKRMKLKPVIPILKLIVYVLNFPNKRQ